MKKILASILTILLLFACVSCGDNGNTEDAYTSICSQLEKTSMRGTEYSQTQIDELEARFKKNEPYWRFCKSKSFQIYL